MKNYKLFRKKISIALMIDQRLSEGEKISFFKKDASTTTLPAQIAFKICFKYRTSFYRKKKR